MDEEPQAPSAPAVKGRVRSSDSAPLQVVSAATATEMQMLLGPEDGMPHFAMRRFIMGEGGGMPRHVNQVEHQQYVLNGRARVSIGDEVIEVKPGDAVYIPARVPHSYQVLEAPFDFLCIVPNQTDQIEILDPAD